LFSNEIHVPVAALGPLDPAARVWAADIPSDQSDGLAKDFEDTAIPLEAMPPVLVGPFGTSHSPMLLAAQWLETRASVSEPALPDDAERVRDWLGCIVFGPSGPLGSISDVHLDAEGLRLRDIDLKTDSSTSHRILFDAVRNFVSGEGYAVTDLTLADLEAGLTIAPPGPALPEQPAASWVTTDT